MRESVHAAAVVRAGVGKNFLINIGPGRRRIEKARFAMIPKNNILTNKFVELIEENHQQITEYYMNDLLGDPDTTAYRTLDRQVIYESGNQIYRELSSYITKDFSKDEIAKHYKKLAWERFEKGVPASHVFKALMLLKRHVWLFIQKKMGDDPTDFRQALELSNRVVLYFDRAAHAVLKGYEDIDKKRW